jgi:hypothetical protein
MPEINAPIAPVDLSTVVPYTGATGDVTLGAHNFTCAQLNYTTLNPAISFAGYALYSFGSSNFTGTGSFTTTAACQFGSATKIAGADAYVTFCNAALTRKGYLGVASSGSADMTVASDGGKVIISCPGVKASFDTALVFYCASAVVMTLRDTSANTTAKVSNYITFNGDNTVGRVGFFGFPSSSNTDFYIANEITGSLLHLVAGGTVFSSGKGIHILGDTGNVTLDGKLNGAAFPTSSAGLSAGDIWVDTTGALNILKMV